MVDRFRFENGLGAYAGADSAVAPGQARARRRSIRMIVKALPPREFPARRFCFRAQSSHGWKMPPQPDDDELFKGPGVGLRPAVA
jgi:hypothetical protein